MAKILKMFFGVMVVVGLVLIWIVSKVVRHLFRLADETVLFICRN